MTTFPTQSSIAALSPDGIPTDEQVAFVGAWFRRELHQLVLKIFLRSKMTQRELARRLNKRPEQVNRWLGSATNWTPESISHVLLAMGYIPHVQARPLTAAMGEPVAKPSLYNSRNISLGAETGADKDSHAQVVKHARWQQKAAA